MKTKSILAIVVAYAIMIVAFCAMCILACMVPHHLTDEHIRESMEILEDEGRFPLTCGVLLWGKDNITDGTMFNIAVSGYDMNPVQEAILNPWTYENDSSKHTAYYGLKTLNTQDGTVPRVEYSRYWHGYQLPLRLWSTIFSIHGIRVVNTVILWSLLLITTTMIWTRFGKFVGIGWPLVLLVVGFPAVPLSIQYTTCFYIMFISAIVFLKWPKLLDNLVAYFVIGGLTSFFDYLTTPVLTITIPLIIILLYKRGAISYKRILLVLFIWGLGYGAIWSTKWLISLWLGVDDIEFALNGLSGNGYYTFTALFNWTEPHKYQNLTIGLLLSAFLITSCIYLYRRKKTQYVAFADKLFVVSLIPFGWYIVFLGHSIVHIFFTYRSLIPTAFCCWLLLSLNKIDENKK